MKIINTRYTKYSLPLEPVLKLKQQTLSHRSGFVLGIRTENHYKGFGEASPLPGFHQESLAEVEEELQAARNVLSNFVIPAYLSQLEQEIRDFGSEFIPSVRWAFESALFQAFAQFHQKNLAQIWSKNSLDTVWINGLLAGDYKTQMEKLDSLIKSGFHAIKMKVGSSNIDEDIHYVREVHDRIPKKIQLRLDANCAWDLKQASDFAKGIRDCQIQYCEEPLQNSEELVEFWEKTRFPIGLDESLVGKKTSEVVFFPGIHAIVLKPSIIGSILETRDWMNWARNYEVLPVISSAFDSGIGTSMLVQLAASSPFPKTPVGLDTYSWLAEDLLEERLTMTNGKINVTETAEKAKEIRWQ